MKTSDEARKKWCPMVRAAVNASDQNDCNREINGSDAKIPQYTLCIAAECMCWVWDKRTELLIGPREEVDLPESKWQGHCGLIR